jgi:hemerythrin-like domain-containing protein
MSYDPKNFEIDEVIELKGHNFKVCLIDPFTGKLGLKFISKEEAKNLQPMTSRTLSLMALHEEEATPKKLEIFLKNLQALRGEGKGNLGKNVHNIESAIREFHHDLGGHFQKEEAKIFPYLKKHIPKLEPMIYLLVSEHEDFRRVMREMFLRIKVIRTSRAQSQAAIQELYYKGIHFVAHLRSHMAIESKKLYRIADAELNVVEKKSLCRGKL